MGVRREVSRVTTLRYERKCIAPPSLPTSVPPTPPTPYNTHDKALGGSSDNLLLRLATPAALDAVEARVHLVGAVNGDVQAREAVEISQREAGVDDELRALKRGRDADNILEPTGVDELL